jgi:hypothetical protein
MASKKKPYIGCTIRQLPRGQRFAAAMQAAAINPNNAPPIAAAMALLEDPMRLTVLYSKKWATTGVDLTVQFLDNPDAETRRMILSEDIGANAWEKVANVRFRETAGQGDVRLTRDGSGYWSYLGTDIKSIPAGEATMNLEGFTSRTPVSEYKRVVKHEYGHCLGFPHEHMRKELVDRIDPQKAYDYFMRTQGWDRREVDQQVLTALDERSILGTPADVLSIMCYELPGSITKDGRPIPGGTDIDPTDAEFALKLYPKAVEPPPPPPPPKPPEPPAPPPVQPAALFYLTFNRAVPAGGQIGFASPVRVPVGTYAVAPYKGAKQAKTPVVKVKK